MPYFTALDPHDQLAADGERTGASGKRMASIQKYDWISAASRSIFSLTKPLSRKEVSSATG